MPITPEYLKSILSYSPDTGVFTWLVGRSRTCAGSVAGSLVSSGYLTVMIDRKRHNLHRLAFIYMLDRPPPEFVDHINGLRTDNRWLNLRPASPTENARNQKLHCKNTSGIPGVSWDPRGRWRSAGYLDGKQITLGRYHSMLDASNPKHYKYEWIWEKGAATGFLNAKKQPLRAHESAQVFYRKQPVYNPRMTTGHERKTSKRKSVESECYGKALNLTEYDSTERYPRSVQFFSSDKQTASYHPTQKPVAWMEFLISTYSDQSSVVLDNTMGSGTTGVACMNLRRKFVGIEQDAGYFHTAQQRIADAITVRDTPVPQFDLFATA